MSTEIKGLMNDFENEQQIIRRRRRCEDGNEWRRGIRIWKAVVMSHQERLEETSEKPAPKQPASGQGIETRTSRETAEQMFIKFTRRLFYKKLSSHFSFGYANVTETSHYDALRACVPIIGLLVTHSEKTAGSLDDV
jgi:hypothetical protein